MFRLARGLSLSPFRREWLVKDVVAGIVLTTLLVPQGMAYAELAAVTAFRAGTGADWTPAVEPAAGPAPADPTTRT